MRANEPSRGLVVAASLIALAVWTLAIWGLASQHSYRTRYTEYAAGQSAEAARREIESVCSQEVTPNGYVACTERVLATEAENLRAEYDLQAQQDMAQWAFVLTTITAGQAVIGGVGLYLLVGTFRQTAVQAHAAQRATAKATVANAIARETALNDRRPWLSLKAVPNKAGGITGTELVPGLEIEITNYGRTPAIDVVSAHIVMSFLDSLDLRNEMQVLVDRLVARIDYADSFSDAIVPGETGRHQINGTLPLELAGLRSLQDAGQNLVTAVVVVGAAYRATGDRTVRSTAGVYIYHLMSDSAPGAPDTYQGFVSGHPGGNLIT